MMIKLLFKALVASLVVFSSSAAFAEARLGADLDGGQSALEESLGLWPALSSEERGHMARFYAHIDFEPGLSVLRDCAANGGKERRDCLLALALMDDIDSIVLFRNVLRTSTDPDLVELAAVALGRWGDRLSYSLLNKALFEGRGGDRGGVALQRAILAIPRGPWRDIYVEFSRRRAPSNAARMMAAAVLAPIKGGKAVSNDLFGALESLMTRDDWWSEHNHQARIAIWGATRIRAGGGCSKAVGILKAAAENHPEGSARVAAVWSAVDPRCARRALRPLQKAGVVLPKGPADPTWLDKRNLPVPAVPRVDCTQIRAWLTDLSLRGELWDARGMPPELASQATKTLCAPGVERAGWGAAMLFHAAPTQKIALKAPKDAQTRTINEPKGLYPESFDTFAPPLKQPDWYPKYVEVTIDDGPQLGLHKKVSPVLREFGVQVTWFMCGVNILRQYNRNEAWTVETIQSLVDSGDHIAYHTMNHVTKRSEHVMNMTPEQLQDDVQLFELVIKMVGERDVDLIYGRMPGGLGTFRAESRKAYHSAGMSAPVFWNAGPPGWPPRAGAPTARVHACTFLREKKPIILLLHETAGLENELRAFFGALKAGCKR